MYATDDTWYVYSRASSHMAHKSCILSELKHYNRLDKVIVGNISHLDIPNVGNTNRLCLKIQEVLVVPKITKNLLAVSKIFFSV